MDEHTGNPELEQIRRLIGAVADEPAPTHTAAVALDQLLTLDGAVAGIVLRVVEGHPSTVAAMVGDVDVTALVTRRSPLNDAIGRAQPVWTETRSRFLRRYPTVLSGTAGWVAAPILGEDMLGVLCIGFERSQPLATAERRLLLIACDLLALSFAAEDDTGDTEQQVATRATEISLALERSEVLSQIAEVTVPRVADWCALYLQREDRLERIMTAHRDPSMSALAADTQEAYPYPIDAKAPLVEAFHAQRGRLIEDVGDATLETLHPDPAYTDIMRRLGLRSLMYVPLVARDRAIGVLAFVSSGDRRFDAEDLALAELVAGHAARALDVSAAVEQERELAHALQRSTLPRGLPQVPGFDLASVYEPARTEAPVGGDWYDALRLRDGRLGLVVGDVAGHGMEAATRMAQLRNAVRAYLFEGHRPGRTLELGNELLLAERVHDHATVVAATLDPWTGQLVIARAGHPPAVSSGPGGTVVVDGRTGPPLGAFPDATFPETAYRLQQGATLYLYTDGLVEERDEVLDAGLDRLVAAASRLHELSARQLATRLVRELVGSGSGDDTCLLVLRRQPGNVSTFREEIPTESAAVPPLRRSFRSWLEVAGATEKDAEDLTLVLSELCANALAASTADDPITITAHLDHDVVTLEVSNTGPAFERPEQDPDPLSITGRGLRIVDAATDGLRIAHDGQRAIVSCRRRIGETTAPRDPRS